MGAHEAVPPDPRMVQHRRADPDQAALPDRAAMQHDAVSDGAIVTDGQRRSHVRMHDGVFLDIGARADGDPFVVAAQDASKPHARLVAEADAADDGCVWRHPESAGSGKFGRLPVERIDRHRLLLAGLRPCHRNVAHGSR